MSTNYYFDIDTNCKYCKKKRLHIGKRSGGWKPVFHHTEYYSSVNEIIDFYRSCPDVIDIINEYGDILTLDELRSQLIDWNRDNSEAAEQELIRDDYKDDEGYLFIKSEFS